jgi:hypothetical protein
MASTPIAEHLFVFGDVNTICTLRMRLRWEFRDTLQGVMIVNNLVIRNYILPFCSKSILKATDAVRSLTSVSKHTNALHTSIRNNHHLNIPMSRPHILQNLAIVLVLRVRTGLLRRQNLSPHLVLVLRNLVRSRRSKDLHFLREVAAEVRHGRAGAGWRSCRSAGRSI